MRELDYNATLQATIKHGSSAPANAEASGGADGIWLRPDLAKEREPRLGFVLSEEVRHCYLSDRTGIPHDTFIEVLLQELFATWVQYCHSILSGRIPDDWLTSKPVRSIPPGAEPRDFPVEVGYDIGKHTAAAALGNDASRERLDAWFADPTAPDEAKELAARLHAVLPWEGTAAAMASTLGKVYEALISGDEGGES